MESDLEFSSMPLRSFFKHIPASLMAVSFTFISAYAHRASAAADSLNAKFAAIKNDLNNNSFHRPLTLDSVESSNQLKGDVYALIDHPFKVASATLQVPSNWCDILILHLNTKYCKANTNENKQSLKVYFGKKNEQPLEDAYAVDLAYRVGFTDRSYLGVELSADKGPMGTSNYLISLEAIPVGTGTGGAQQSSNYIDGIRGMLERNTMRYYLAIDTYLGSLSDPSIKRLQNWFAATERYPLQLQEISRNAYLKMKQAELRRMGDIYLNKTIYYIDNWVIYFNFNRVPNAKLHGLIEDALGTTGALSREIGSRYARGAQNNWLGVIDQILS